MKKRIIVLGGGYAGVLTAKKLARKFKAGSDVHISLIDKHPFHTMLTELHEVAACRVEPDSIKVSLERVFAGRNVEVHLDTITSIDFDRKALTGINGCYEYDYLVVATGSQPTFFGIPGAEEHAHRLWSYEDAVKLRNHMVDVFAKAALEADPAKRRKLLTFYVVGAGFTGVEMTGELAEWLPNICAEYELDNSEVTIANVDVLERVVPTLPKKLSVKVQRRLEKMGVNVILKARVVGIGPDYIEFSEGEETKRVDADTVIWSAGVEGTEISFAAGTEMNQAAGRGRIQTDEYLRVPGHEEVFVAGDNIFYIPDGAKSPVPQMVENCEASSHTISKNIGAAIEGGTMEKYRPKFHGVMVCVGGRYGVAHVGTDRRKFALPSFLAMFTKHFINIVYFTQLLGWNRVYSYLCHEFANVPNNRSFLGGHFSNRVPNFWIVPLRVFLGAIWLYEGISKVLEGWLEEPRLEGFFSGADAFYKGILDGAAAGYGGAPQAAGSAAEAVTGATSAGGAEAAGQVLINWNFFDFIHIILVSASDVAVRIQINLVDWMTNSIILASDGTQIFFQTVIVLLEILIGLSLIGGLFTFLSAGMSLILQLMFLTTTGLYMSSWWMFFAGIAVLIGSGSVLGLDYYVLPYLKKKWKRIGFVRKWYLYND